MKRLILFLCLVSAPVQAADIFQSPDAFVSSQFAGSTPAKQSIPLDGAQQQAVKEIMGDHYTLSKADYWRQGDKTVWVLEEIGKYKPITTGFAVSGDALEEVKVLVYRESHGWEVKYPFFTDQFKQMKIDDDLELDGYINGISGATLSVDALTRKAALALYLHGQVTHE